jgi:hypothetical protein
MNVIAVLLGFFVLRPVINARLKPAKELAFERAAAPLLEIGKQTASG